MKITQLDSDWWHIKGDGPENWAQVPHWPCDEQTIRDHAALGASEEFIKAAALATTQPAQDRAGKE